MSDKPFNQIEHSVVASLIRNEPHEQYEATDFHEALLFAIARELGRVHHNRYQTSWDRWSDDPHIPGIQWRRYAYDCDCPEDHDGFTPRHLEECVLCQPNFGFEDVRFTWYKNPGRGMSINQSWAAEKWQAWFDRCIAKIREFDVHVGGGGHSIAPLPDGTAFYSAACCVLFGPSLSESPLKDELSDLKTNAERGQREIAKESRPDDDKYWSHVEKKDLSPRDVRLIALGVMAERLRSQRNDRPKAENPKPPTR